MPQSRRIISILLMILVAIPWSGVFSDWRPVEIVPTTSVTFPPGGGTCSTGLRLPVDGLVKSTNLTITGQPLYTNQTYSANSGQIWANATQRSNLTLGKNGIGLSDFGSWWEESVKQAWERAPEADRIEWRTVGVNGSILDNWTYDEVIEGLRLAKEFEKPFIVDINTAGLWHFDDGSGTATQDSSVNGNSGSLMNGPIWTDGKYKKAIEYDGNNDYTTMADNDAFSFTNKKMSIDAWVKINSNADNIDKAVVTKRSTGMDANLEYGLYISNNKAEFCIWNIAGTVSDDVKGTTTIEVGKWYYLLGTSDGNTIKTYVNGVLDGSSSESVTVTNGAQPLRIGFDGSGMTERYFNGFIDEVRLSNIPRTPSIKYSKASLLSPILNISSYSRIMVEGDFPNGTNYTVDILDPTNNNKTLQKGLKNGDELALSLWDRRETLYRNLVLRLNVNTNNLSVTPVVRKWGVGTGWRDGLETSSNIIMKNPEGMGLGFDSNSPYYRPLKEFPVSTISNNQRLPAVNIDSNETILFAWDDFRNNNNWAIYAQRYDIGGKKYGNEIPISSLTGSGRPPAIGVDSKNNFIVAWADNRNGNLDIFAQRFDSNGNKLGNEIQVCTAAFQQWGPVIAINSEDNFIIAWVDYRSGGAYSDIYAKRYYANGSVNGSEIAVSTVNEAQLDPAIAIDSHDNFIITWHDHRIGESDIYSQRFKPDGTKLGTEIPVCTSGGNQAHPGIAVDSKNNFIITWNDYTNGVNWAKRFDSNGNALGSDIVVSSVVNGQSVQVIKVDSKDNFIVVWDDYRSGSNYDIYAQTFKSSGAKIGNEILVSSKINDQQWPALVIDSKENLIITWQDFRGGSDWDIYASRFVHPYLPCGTYSTSVISPFFHTFGNIFVNATTPPSTGYWVNVTDINNNALQSHLRNGDPILVNVTKYPKIRLNLTLWTSNVNRTPVVYELGIGLSAMQGPAEMLKGGHQNLITSIDGNDLGLAYDRWIFSNLIGTPKPYGNSAPWLVHVGNGIYLSAGRYMGIGPGLGDSGPEIYGYNESNGSWWQETTVPATPVRGTAAWDGGDYLYVVLGCNQQTFWRYSISQKTWSTLTGTPGPVHTGSLVNGENGYFYLLRGSDGASYTPDLWRYSVAGNSWTSMANMPVSVSIMTLMKGPGKDLYATGPPLSTYFYRYNITTNSWIRLSDPPVDISTVPDGLVWDKHDLIYVLDYARDAVYRYSISSDQWEFVVSTPNQTSSQSLELTTNGSIFIIPGNYTSTFWRLDPVVYKSHGTATAWLKLPVVPTRFTVSWGKETPANTSVTAKFRASKDNSTWSNWIVAKNGGRYSPNDLTSWGPFVQYNLSLDSSRWDTTPVLFDFRIDYCPYLLTGNITGISTASQSAIESTIISAHPVVNATVSPGTYLDLYLSADNGTTWQKFKSNTKANFTVPGNSLKWMALFQGNGNSTSYMKGFKIEYTIEHQPSEVAVDIGLDGLIEWRHSGLLNGTVPAGNLTDAINSYVTAHYGEAVAGYITVPLNISSATGGIITLRDAAIDFVPDPKILNHSPTGTDVLLNRSITISFSEAMNLTFIMNSIIITPALVTTPSWSVDGKNLTLSHGDFKEDQIYNVTIKAGALSSAGASLQKDFSWQFTTLLIPTVVSFNPKGNDVPLITTMSIVFNKPMNHTSVESAVSIEPFGDPTSPAWIGDDKVSFVLTLFKPETRYNVTVSVNAMDSIGIHLRRSEIFNFTTRKAAINPPNAPNIIDHKPIGDRVPIKPVITISFDRAMNPTSVFPAIQIIPKVELDPSIHLVSLSSYNYTIAGELAYGTTYYVIVGTSAKSLASVNMTAPFIWNFTTVKPGEKSKDLPYIFETIPEPNAKNVSQNTIVMMAFSQAMNKTYPAGTFSITPTVDGTWSWNTGMSVIIKFTPKNLLPVGKYTVVVSANITDESGNPLDGNRNGKKDGLADSYSFEFTVGVPQIIRPKLISRSPEGKDIGLNEPIKLTFDRSMNLTSIKAAFTLQPNVDGVWTIDSTGKNITFTPTKKYRAGASYTINISKSAKDLNGNSLENDIGWSFITKKATTPSVLPSCLWWVLVLIGIGIVGGAAVYWRYSKTKSVEPEPEEEEEAEPEEEPEEVAETIEPKAEKKPIPKSIKGSMLINDIFLIYKDGRLIEHLGKGKKDEDHDDIMSGMLTALQQFVKETLKKDEDADLGAMEYGDMKIIFERSSNLVLAMVIKGKETEEVRDEMHRAVEKIEGDHAGIVEEWDGEKAKFKGLGLIMGGLMKLEVVPKAHEEDPDNLVRVMSGMEFHQGFVRLKIAIKDNLSTTITGASFNLIYDKKALKFSHIEPEFERSGTNVEIGNVEPGQKKTVAYYLDPLICQESVVDGTLTFKDFLGALHHIDMKRRPVDIVCPMFYTEETVNVAMLKRLLDKLAYKDCRMYRFESKENLEDIFKIGKAVVQGYDIKFVREFVEETPFQMEAWFYGKTKETNEEMVIKVAVTEADRILEISVNSSNLATLTGLLAELRNKVKTELGKSRRIGKIGIVSEKNREDIICRTTSLLSKFAETELKADETEKEI